jgi:hypothetical protein
VYIVHSSCEVGLNDVSIPSLPSGMLQGKLRVTFIHPDLGIGTWRAFTVRLIIEIFRQGGAERLVVDAALALQNQGHDVAFFTSHHDPKRCFEETRDGNTSSILSSAFASTLGLQEL